MKVCIFLIWLIFSLRSPLFAQQTDSLAQDSLRLLPEKFQKILILADSLKQESTSEVEGLRLGGLIIDQTVSKFGRDFYDYFYSAWQEPGNMHDFLLTIRERPLPSIGSIISIELDGEVLWEQRIQPRADALEGSAGQAALFFYQYLVNYQAIQKSLENEDQQGSGIF